VLVDVVIVAYNSGTHLRACVAPFASLDDTQVIVVDNDSTDHGLDTIEDLPAKLVRRSTNDGFATGCNAGWREGSAPFVLFLNPDAIIDQRSLRHLVAVLENDGRVGIAAPRLEGHDGGLLFSQRRFPTLRSTYAQALFLHRLFPRASWSDEIVRDPDAYVAARSPDWVSGACILVRRSTLEQLGGWDERYFLYCEDIDLCRRVRGLGLEVRFDPAAVAVHSEGHSAPSATTIPLLAASKAHYASNTRGGVAAIAERIGLAVGALTHLLLGRGGIGHRRAHLRALRAVGTPGSRTGSGNL
jgi:N-acetylglucosaminyl-diphospho-decaprenol L-rhamnosyltransferase